MDVFEYSNSSITWLFEVGNPPETFQWYFKSTKDGIFGKLNNNYDGNILTLQNVTHAMAGLYKCTATNKVGQTSVEVLVQVICEFLTILFY